jgi:hypothetical protein
MNANYITIAGILVSSIIGVAQIRISIKQRSISRELKIIKTKIGSVELKLTQIGHSNKGIIGNSNDGDISNNIL